MSNTIDCTNPSCNETIDVPAGALQVVCPGCQTWHFPPSEMKEGGNSYEDNIGYDVPGEVEDNSLYQVPSTPQDQPVFEEQRPPQDMAVPTKIEEPKVIQEDPNEFVSEADTNRVVAYLNTQTGERLPIKIGVNTIGRKDCDLTIDDKTVSRRHCVIEANEHSDGGVELYIYDIGHMEGNASTNGVFVSGRSLRLQDYERVPVKNGTAINIGNVRLDLKLAL